MPPAWLRLTRTLVAVLSVLLALAWLASPARGATPAAPAPGDGLAELAQAVRSATLRRQHGAVAQRGAA
ncbi:hypothetical protein, partial [Cupriavidus sp. TA19]|uniref:hypothetical protein n=1 Tax=Cupriavidus sp. TA19 TaxID=701108 RepID=UPI00295E6223